MITTQRATWLAIVAALIWIVLGATLQAQQPAARPPPASDPLLDSLRDELPPKPPPARASERQPIDTPPAGEDLGKPGEVHPLVKIGQQMRSSESLIPRSANREAAVEVQERIIADLSRLIEQAEKQNSSNKSSSANDQQQQQTSDRKPVQQPQAGNQPRQVMQPGTQSANRMGETAPARPDPAAVQALMKDAWGHLPAHAREQMLQNSPERFVPQYELMIERYYKRLAEERFGR